MTWSGIKPATSRSQVLRANHSATNPNYYNTVDKRSAVSLIWFTLQILLFAPNSTTSYSKNIKSNGLKNLYGHWNKPEDKSPDDLDLVRMKTTKLSSRGMVLESADPTYNDYILYSIEVTGLFMST
ncbi:hypothetical protein ElyMa_004428000 [Elysia marginata]|uniref:Uncharacterized protein n=1 Tax=Elysia marginata TaxID=1093978 RepID=A0AAV4HCJ0_9GAST|nr:hypothetical protein ElyMa_004428000 [Elysia marginata]